MATEVGARLEDLTPGARVLGIIPAQVVTVVQVEWHGTQALTLTYRDDAGRVDHQLIYRGSEAALQLEQSGRSWSFDGDGKLFRLAAEALRIHLAHLFDPYLAVHTSSLEPLPHQIRAVYGDLLPRQPLRFLLADDPGAGKTIMAGLSSRSSSLRGDLNRCLVVAPGGLVEQWQDELVQKFGLDFDILARETIEASCSGNPFVEKHRSSSPAWTSSRAATRSQAEARSSPIGTSSSSTRPTRWAPTSMAGRSRRPSATSSAGCSADHPPSPADDRHAPQRQAGGLPALSGAARSRPLRGQASARARSDDTSGLMRRMVKEELLTFEGKPLFPERRAYTVHLQALRLERPSSTNEVTDYVRDEMNRADRARRQARGNVVGFALTVLQRRLASSPGGDLPLAGAPGRERLETRVSEERLAGSVRCEPGSDAGARRATRTSTTVSRRASVEEIEERVVDQASAAQTRRRAGRRDHDPPPT